MPNNRKLKTILRTNKYSCTISPYLLEVIQQWVIRKNDKVIATFHLIYQGIKATYQCLNCNAFNKSKNPCLVLSLSRSLSLSFFLSISPFQPIKLYIKRYYQQCQFQSNWYLYLICSLTFSIVNKSFAMSGNVGWKYI